MARTIFSFLSFLNIENGAFMQNIKKVLITVDSRIENLDAHGLAEGETEKSRIEAVGDLRFSEDGAVTLSYTEKTEGGAVCSDIEFSGDEIRVARRGAVHADMLFREGITHRGLYKVPPFSFDMEILATRVRTDISQDSGEADIIYSMTIGGANKKTRMRISYRKTGDGNAEP